MNNLSQKLDEYIKRLKIQFPDFEYNNTIKDNFDEKELLPDKFTIVVRGVRKERIKEVRSFIRNEIYSNCIDNDELLPNVITLQNYSKNYNWSIKFEKRFKFTFGAYYQTSLGVTSYTQTPTSGITKQQIKDAAEDYSYAMAA